MVGTAGEIWQALVELIYSPGNIYLHTATSHCATCHPLVPEFCQHCLRPECSARHSMVAIVSHKEVTALLHCHSYYRGKLF